MSIYMGDTLISGKGVIIVDDELSALSTNPIQNKVVAEAIKNVNTDIISTTNKYVNTSSVLDTDDKFVYAEYSKKNGITDTNKTYRFFTPNGNKWADLIVQVTEQTAMVNIFSSTLDPVLFVNGKKVYHEGYQPYVVSTFTAISGSNAVKLNFAPKFVIFNDSGTAKFGITTSGGFIANVTNAGECSYIAFR